MKKNNRKKPRNAITAWRIGKRHALLTALFLPGLVFPQTVDISPTVSTGATEAPKEDQANLWFLLDDSGSMGVNRGGTNRKDLMWGYIPYDSSATYVLPNKIDGLPMPLPASGNRVYITPFIYDSKNLSPSSWTTTNIFRFSQTGNWGDPQWQNVPACSTLDPGNLNNCYIWRNYYSSKIGVLKATLSLNLFGAANAVKTEKARLGFTSLHNNNKSGSGSSKLPTNILPVLPFYGPVANDNKAKFQRWLYSLYASGGTPLRHLYSKTVSDIITQSKESNSGYDSTKNPFVDIPGQPISASNELMLCRRNYIVLFTDGNWNSTAESVVVNNLASPSYINTNGVNKTDTFPDGMFYSRFAPFGYDLTSATASAVPPPTPLTDIAFAAWKTDMDDDSSTNGLIANNKGIGTPSPGIVQVHTGPSGGTASPYWHPYNDPASWQHINTYTIGFGLSNPDNFHVNPPTAADPEGIDLTQVWRHQIWASMVGISKSVSDLANAAVAGRGRFYDTQTAADLTNALDDITANLTGPSSTPTVSGSGGAAGASQKLDNSYYVSRYDATPFTGELIKYNLYIGDPSVTCDTPTTVIGSVCNTAWNAGKILTAAGPGSRNIITLKRQKSGSDLTAMNDPDLTVSNLGYKVVDFKTTEISPAQQTRLESVFPSELTSITPEADRLPALFNYIRGDDTNEPGGSGTETFRDRNEHAYLNNDTDGDGEISGDADDDISRDILGAIMRSSPVFVGIPNGYVKHFQGAGTAYNNYITYLNSYINSNSSGDKEVIYVGSDDGMLHAFKANTGEELFAYIPSAVYDKLPRTVVPDEQLSLVDGNMDVQSVYFGTTWYRVLAGSMGGGAKGLYALNITNPDISDIKSSSVINWEYGELESKLYQKAQGIASPKSNIGNILAKPAIIQLQDNTWVAIVGNGYNSESNKAAVIIINLETGEPIQELVLDTANTYSDSTKANGLGPLYFTSYPDKPRDKSNQYDRAYAGDLQGNLWVFDLEGSDASTGIKVINKKSGDTSGTPLFTAKDSAGKRQPITVYPLAVRHPLNYGYLIHFGTGALFAPDDLSSKQENSIYAIWDDWVDSSHGGLPTPRTSTVTDDRTTSSELNEVKLTEELVSVQRKNDAGTLIEVNASVRKLLPIGPSPSDNHKTDWKLGVDGTHRGWRIDLNDGNTATDSTATDSERAWQPAYTAYGGKNVKAIAYNTVRYTDEGGAICRIPGKQASSWNLAFNIDDAAVKLPKSGVLDINKDSNVTEADRKIKNASGDYIIQDAVQGLLATDSNGSSEGIITQNPTTQQLNELSSAGVITPGHGANAERTVCRTITQLVASSGGVITPTTVERCSYFSSWTELK